MDRATIEARMASLTDEELESVYTRFNKSLVADTRTRKEPRRDDTRDEMTAVLHGLSCVQALLRHISGYGPGQELKLDSMRQLLVHARSAGLEFNRQRDQT